MVKGALIVFFSAAGLRAAPLAPAPVSARGAAISGIENMIRAIKNNKRSPAEARRRAGVTKVFAFTEQEVNDYLVHWIENEGNKGKNKEISIKSGSVRLHPGHILEADAVARLEMGSLKSLNEDPDSLLSRTLKRCLTVDNTLHAQILLVSAKGKIFLKVQEVKLKGIPFPDAWVQKILQAVGQKQRPPLDFNKFFDLPNGIEKVEVMPQAIKIYVKMRGSG